jgi:hypothetical protein
MPEPAHDALEALRARLAETRAQAERLAEEVAAARAARPGAEEPPSETTRTTSDLQALAALLETLRELVPPELQQQLADVTRQVLLLLRALIDVLVERLEPPAVRPEGPAGGDEPAGAPEPARARDIPVT